MDPFANRQIIFEMFSQGQYMKVTAMDSETLTEVSIQGPVGAPEEYLKQNALKRLEYVMKKKGLLRA